MSYAMERAAAVRAAITSETTRMEKMIALRDELAELNRTPRERMQPWQRDRAATIAAALRGIAR